MNITPHNNLPISAGFQTPSRQRGSSADQQQKSSTNNPLQSQIVQSQFNATGNAATNLAASQRIRPTISAQPMLDQNLTHRGAQAKNVYQGVELSSEAELMPRLNVIA